MHRLPSNMTRRENRRVAEVVQPLILAFPSTGCARSYCTLSIREDVRLIVTPTVIPPHDGTGLVGSDNLVAPQAHLPVTRPLSTTSSSLRRHAPDVLFAFFSVISCRQVNSLPSAASDRALSDELAGQDTISRAAAELSGTMPCCASASWAVSRIPINSSNSASRSPPRLMHLNTSRAVPRCQTRSQMLFLLLVLSNHGQPFQRVFC